MVKQHPSHNRIGSVRGSGLPRWSRRALALGLFCIVALVALWQLDEQTALAAPASNQDAAASDEGESRSSGLDMDSEDADEDSHDSGDSDNVAPPKAHQHHLLVRHWAGKMIRPKLKPRPRPRPRPQPQPQPQPQPRPMPSPTMTPVDRDNRSPRPHYDMDSDSRPQPNPMRRTPTPDMVDPSASDRDRGKLAEDMEKRFREDMNRKDMDLDDMGRKDMDRGDMGKKDMDTDDMDRKDMDIGDTGDDDYERPVEERRDTNPVVANRRKIKFIGEVGNALGSWIKNPKNMIKVLDEVNPLIMDEVSRLADARSKGWHTPKGDYEDLGLDYDNDRGNSRSSSVGITEDGVELKTVGSDDVKLSSGSRSSLDESKSDSGSRGSLDDSESRSGLDEEASVSSKKTSTKKPEGDVTKVHVEDGKSDIKVEEDSK